MGYTNVFTFFVEEGNWLPLSLVPRPLGKREGMGGHGTKWKSQNEGRRKIFRNKGVKTRQARSRGAAVSVSFFFFFLLLFPSRYGSQFVPPLAVYYRLSFFIYIVLKIFYY